MLFHIVKEGENIFSVARQYHVSPTRLIEENALSRPYDLLTGQSLLVSRPERMYTVRGGDSFASICRRFSIDERALRRANPGISGQSVLFPGQILATYEPPSSWGTLSVYGYAETDDEETSITSALPYLTSLTHFGGFLTDTGLSLPVSPFLQHRHLHQNLPSIFVGIRLDNKETALFPKRITPSFCSSLCNTLSQAHFSGIMLSFSSRQENPLFFHALRELHDTLSAHKMMMTSACSDLLFTEYPDFCRSVSAITDGLVLFDTEPEKNLQKKLLLTPRGLLTPHEAAYFQNFLVQLMKEKQLLTEKRKKTDSH